MSGTNDYKLYAGSAGANVITQAQYLALTSILANGMSDGIVPSAQFNKILRQLSMGSAALGKIIADNNVNAVDDGNVSDFVSKLLAALNTLLAIPTVPGFATNAEAQAQTSTTKTLSPATLATALQGSNQSLSANGYQKLPGGLILQWGSFSIGGAGASVATTFPVAFPLACRSVSVSATGGHTDSWTRLNATAPSNTGFTTWNDGNATTISWMAIGY